MIDATVVKMMRASPWLDARDESRCSVCGAEFISARYGGYSHAIKALGGRFVVVATCGSHYCRARVLQC